MQEFCPLCMINGVQKKVKLMQINLHEAVRTCESEKCIWPFGYDQLTLLSRPIGKTWSCYWDDCKTLQRTETVTIPDELSLYTPPATPCRETVKEQSDIFHINDSETQLTTKVENKQSKWQTSAPFSKLKKRNSESKQYEKFSFSSIRKKESTDQTVDNQSTKSNSGESENNLSTKDKETDDTDIINMENILNDLLSDNNQSVAVDINDDWINDLLT